MMKVIARTDQDLVTQYLKGDESAFVELLNRHQKNIYSTIYLFVRDSVLADDIFQEAFIKIIDNLRRGKYNNEGKFLQWANRIAYNLCVDNFRIKKNKPVISPSITDDFDLFKIIPIFQESADEKIMKSQTHILVRELLDKLPSHQREVIILRHFADLTFKEISILTRVSVSTSIGRMRYGLLSIRKLVEEKNVVLL